MKRFAILLVLALLLTGCATAPAQESTVPNTTLPAKTEPVATTPSTAPVTEPATEPATEPPTEPAEPYDTYFATEIPIPIQKSNEGKSYIYFEKPHPEGEFPNLVSDFYVSQYGWKREDLGRPVLYTDDARSYRVLSEDMMAEVEAATLNYCVAISEDRGTLLRISYTEGVEPVALYTDRYHRLNQPEVYDQCLFFIAGVDSHTNGIYRYYLPDGTIDLLVPGLPLNGSRETIRYDIVSNVTLSWCCTDLPTLEEMKEYWNYDSTGGEGRTPRVFFAEIMGQDFATAADFLAANNTERIHQYEELLDCWLYRNKGIYSQHYCYQNFLTGVKLEAYSYAYHQPNELYYPDGSERPEEDYPNHRLWWLDSYYQT